MGRQILWTIGRRGVFLLFLAMLDFVYAHALAFPTAEAAGTQTYIFLAHIVPLQLWAVLWFLVGCMCAIFAFRVNDAPGYSAAIFIKVLWAGMFLLGWIFAGVERGYVSMAIWGAFAGVVGIVATWPDEVRMRR